MDGAAGIVLFIDSVHPQTRISLTAAGYSCIPCHEKSLEEIKALLPTASGIVIRHRYRMDEEFLNGAHQLKWIARSGVGLDNVDLIYCEGRGIRVLNAAGGNADAVGEHVIGMLLMLHNHLKRADAEVREGVWKREANRGTELGSKTIGIIGYGHTGRSLAEKLSGFGAMVMAYDKYAEVTGPHARSASLDEIKKSCDIISFHVPLTAETQHYFNHDFLAAMHKPFMLVNAARGGVADARAIADGVKSGKIIGAALDVLEEEGLDGDRLEVIQPDLKYLMSCENVLFSPHIAGWTVESYEGLAKKLIERILDQAQ